MVSISGSVAVYSLCWLHLECTPMVSISGSVAVYSLCGLHLGMYCDGLYFRLSCCVFSVLVTFGHVLRWSLFQEYIPNITNTENTQQQSLKQRPSEYIPNITHTENT